MEIIKIIFVLIIAIVIVIALVAGTWWVVLWSFNFPIAFAWKQVIGILAFSFLMNAGSLSNKD